MREKQAAGLDAFAADDGDVAAHWEVGGSSAARHCLFHISDVDLNLDGESALLLRCRGPRSGVVERLGSFA